VCEVCCCAVFQSCVFCSGSTLWTCDPSDPAGAFNRLVAETEQWLGGDAAAGHEVGDDVASTLSSEDSQEQECTARELRRQAAAAVDVAIAEAAAAAEEGVEAGAGRGVGAVTRRSDTSSAEQGKSEEEVAVGKSEEEEERARLEDLAFFVSQMKAYASRLRGEADRAAVMVQELEGTFRPPRDAPPAPPTGAAADGGAPPVPSGGGAVEGAGAPVAQPGVAGGIAPRKRRILSAAPRSRGGAARSDLDITRQRGSGVFGVYTMHGASATRLGDDERHALLHMNHISAPQVIAFATASHGRE